MKLFPKEKVAGIFRGFSEGGMEFHADLVLPYQHEFTRTPMHGQFLLVELEHEDEAVLGRITSIFSLGRLTSGAGEDYSIRALADERPIPEDLRESYLKYQVDIRVLGVLRKQDGQVVFAASHRRLPHVGSKVAFLADDLLQEVVGHNLEGAELGYFSLGEFIYAGDDERVGREPWMRVLSPAVIPRFQVHHIVARRTFVFARAGFGKSNLVKLFFSNLYQETPTVEKRGGVREKVGTIIFDPDGEYFWPDDKNRPGLCDVPHLQDKLVVFTNRSGPSGYYQSFVAGGVKLDIRRLRPADVLSVALSSERQEQQNVRKLKGMNDNNWRELVDLIYREGNGADGNTIKRLLRLEQGQEAEMVAARANMTAVVKMLHDPSSQTLDMLFRALRDGNLCVVDLSQMRGSVGLALSGLILQKIFDHNQQEFTNAKPAAIPVLIVLEEAQSVLGGSGREVNENPYVTWVKEGRKYDLGAVLITQQPGSISSEILSQGDNWFVFHLLSAGDLMALKNANAHFSNDLLSSLLNEPIVGQGVFWSSVGGKSYPIPFRGMSFEGQYDAVDPDYERPPLETCASQLRAAFLRELEKRLGEKPVGEARSSDASYGDTSEVDALSIYLDGAVRGFESEHEDMIIQIRERGVPWGVIKGALLKYLPGNLSDRDNIAFHLVQPAMNKVFGEGGWGTEKRDKRGAPGQSVTYVIIPTEEGSQEEDIAF